MDVIEKLTQLLESKMFDHNGKEYVFVNCKKVANNIMILTNKETIQIDASRFVDFYEKVKGNCRFFEPKKPFVPVQSVAENPAHKAVVMPVVPKIFEKLNESFESLIDSIDNATDANIGFLEAKAKMLTSVAQTAVNIENSKVGLMKAISK